MADHCARLLADLLKERKLLPADDIDRFVKEFESLRRLKEKELGAGREQEAITVAGTEMAKRQKRAAYIKKRNSYINFRRYVDNVEFVARNFGNDFVGGLESLLVGTKFQTAGARQSIDTAQRVLKDEFYGLLDKGLRTEGVFDLYTGGKIDREIYLALWNLDKKGSAKGIDKTIDNVEIPEEAVKIAKIIFNVKEDMRLRANDLGADIGLIAGHVEQTHDSSKMGKMVWDGEKLQGKTAQDLWEKFVDRRIDWEKTLPGSDAAERAKFLDSFYQRVSTGVDLNSRSDGNMGFQGSRNVAGGLSNSRILHFKDAISAFDYSKSYGRGSIRESFSHRLETMAETIGLMQTFGTNPEKMLNNLRVEFAQRARKTFKGKNKQKQINALTLGKTEKSFFGDKLEIFFKQLSGELNTPSNHTAAKIFSFIRALNNMKALGASVISAFSDLALISNQMRYMGASFLDAYSTPVKVLFRGVFDNRQLQLDAGVLGLTSDSLMGAVANRFGLKDGISGRVGRLQQRYFKANLLQWWTDASRAVAGISVAKRIAQVSDLKWSQMTKELDISAFRVRRMLELYGIDENIWNVLRKDLVGDISGQKIMAPELVRDLSDSTINKLMDNVEGGKRTRAAAEVRVFKRKFEQQIKSIIHDQVDAFTVLKPTARTMAATNLGFSRGSLMGEALRSFMQFKTFGLAMLQGTITRNFQVTGVEKGLSLGRLFMTMSALGYLSMTTKDIIRGKTARTLWDGQHEGEISLENLSSGNLGNLNLKTTTAAILQGGGLGFYGDVLFAATDLSRYGRGLAETFGGPTFTSAYDALKLPFIELGQGGKALLGEENHFGFESYKFLLNHAPGSNLFYARPALNYLLLNDIAEELRPGYIGNVTSRMEANPDQNFWLNPGSASGVDAIQEAIDSFSVEEAFGDIIKE